MSLEDIFDRAVASLHGAALDDARWPATARLIDEACAMRGNALVVGKGRSQKDGRIFFARFCCHGERYEDREKWYFDHFYPLDERVPRVVRLPDSRLLPIADLYTEQELKTSPAYNTALAQCGYQNGLNVRLDGPDESHIVWTLADSTDPNGWGCAQVEVIERLLPHIRHFVGVRQAVGYAKALGDSVTQLLDAARIGVVCLSRRGRILEMNERARDLLRRRDGLYDEEGFLRSRLPSDQAALERLLADALPSAGARATGSSMTVTRPTRLTRLTLHVAPMAAPWRTGQLDFGLSGIAAVALIVEPAGSSQLDPVSVSKSLGLTPGESRVAASLAEGLTIRDIAAATQRKESSVRTHLKRIFRKQGVSRQADLVRLVLSTQDQSAPRR